MSTNNGVFPSDVRAAAQHYHEQGFIPIPVPRIGDGKSATLKDWQKLRPSAADLDQLFPPNESLNVGLLLGSPSGGLIDIDLDQPEAILAAPVLLPATGWISGHPSNPRSHYWYCVTDPPNLAQTAFCDVDGKMLVEIRSTGGQTVVPPSMHFSGGSIEWHSLTQPSEPHFPDLRIAVCEVASVVILARHWPSKGTRQSAFMALAGALNRAGWSAERIDRFLQALCVATRDEEERKRLKIVTGTQRKAETGSTTGWPRLVELMGAQGKAVVDRVRQWLGIAADKPRIRVREIPAFKPFPVHALPVVLRRYVDEGAAALGCDPTYLALPIMAVAGGCIGNTRIVRLKRSWDEPAVIWSMIVGDSGTLKTPAFQKVMGYLFRKQKQLFNDHNKAMADFQNEMAEYRQKKKAAEKDEKEPHDEPEEPLLKRLVCSDTTIEKLAEILDDNPRGTFVARDELAGWFGSFTRYKAQKGSTDLPNWLEMSRAGTIIVDRKTGQRPTLYVMHSAVSLTGGIQPGILARAMTTEFFESGLSARILMANPPKVKKRWTELEIDPATERNYSDLIDRLVELDPDHDEDGIRPFIIELSPDAKAIWVKFYEEWAQVQANVSTDLAAAFSKLEGYAARLALMHHVVSHVAVESCDLVNLGSASIEAGIEMTRWFAAEIQRIYMMLSESEEERDIRTVLEFVQRKGGRISVRDLQNSNSRKYPDSETAQAVLNKLVEADLADWEPESPNPKGGHTTRWIVLRNPSDTSDTRPGKDDDGGSAPSDTRPQPNPTPAGNHLENDRVSEVSDEVRKGSRSTTADHGPTGEEQVSDASVGQVCRHILIESAADLPMVLGALDQTSIVGLDLETTGLNPRRDQARLLTLACDTIDGGQFAYIVDLFKVDPSPLWEPLAEKELVIHNGAFDLGFLWQLGFRPNARVHDTMLLAQLILMGTRGEANLAACCSRWLKKEINKEHQLSDWTGILTQEQLTYAAEDVLVLRPLLTILNKEIDGARLRQAADIELGCLPAIVWMAQSGVAFDLDAWQDLSKKAEQEAVQLRQQLDEIATGRGDGQLFEGSWNWDSPAQVKEALANLGIEVSDTNDETLAKIDHPLAQCIRDYREVRKRVTSYGDKWAKHIHSDGRVYPHWRQIGASSGRMACSEPNMQNLPRGNYRRCIVAPPGRVLIKADYSQIELRIAAKLTGDSGLQEAYKNGEDLHERTARMVLCVQEVTKEHRQLAKALNFGLLYGMGAKGFRAYARTSYGVELSEEEATKYRRAFFEAYPGLARWHRQVGNSQNTPIECRTLTGRRCSGVQYFNEKLNLPVQGTGADGLKAAISLMWERREQLLDVIPVLAVHDEIVVESSDANRESASYWLKQVMIDAMAPLINPISVEVQFTFGTTWCG